MKNETIVIIGGGHAAAQMCAGLAEAGAGSRTTLVCGEPMLPYQRPPLSTGFLKKMEEIAQLHRAEAWYADAGITVRLGEPATAIDPMSPLISHEMLSGPSRPGSPGRPP